MEKKAALTERNRKLRKPNIGSPNQDPVPSHKVKSRKLKIPWDEPNSMRPPSTNRR